MARPLSRRAFSRIGDRLSKELTVIDRHIQDCKGMIARQQTRLAKQRQLGREDQSSAYLLRCLQHNLHALIGARVAFCSSDVRDLSLPSL
ncbi:MULTISPECIES: hypothetical protein [Caballeronia]|jgi:hypothetical protein|nr:MULTISPECIES: hypothetical protein [Caballeronia]